MVGGKAYLAISCFLRKQLLPCKDFAWRYKFRNNYLLYLIILSTFETP